MTNGYELEVRVKVALDRFHLDVDHTTRHRVTGIFGPSGSGKTSLLKAIAGLKQRAQGRIRLGERVWLDSERGVYVPPESRDIGYVPQEGLLFPHFNVERNLLAGAARARNRGPSQQKLLSTVCQLLELDHLLDREVASLSGGERQRVSLGRAICSGPRLLLLDEPLASLDIPLRRRVLPFLQRVRHEFDIPMILVSHDPTEVQTLCDHLLVLKDGAVLTSGPTREVLTDPRVFELEGDDGFKNLLPCRVTSSDGKTTQIHLGHNGNGVGLVAPGDSARSVEPGAQLFVAIPAHEIIIARGRPEGISALNVLPARVDTVEAVGADRLVTATISEESPPLTAKVTDKACADLELQPDREVFLIIKAAACQLLGSGPS